MSKIQKAITEIDNIESLADRDEWVCKLHPLVKLAITIYYIVLVVSFSIYDLVGLMAMVVYPIALFTIADLSITDAIKRLRVVLPVICLVGLFNPFLDKNVITIGGTVISAGIISMFTLILKGIFAVLASYILIATTTIEKICYALRLLHVPRIIVTEIMLIYRYVTLLLEEVNRITTAYSLRAPGQKGVHYKVWGSLTGQLLLRSMDRAQNVYDSMTLRGYNGDFDHLADSVTCKCGDAMYLLFWVIILAIFRWIPIIALVGSLF